MGFSMLGALGKTDISSVPDIQMINIANILPDENNFYRVSSDEDIERQNELLKADVMERGIENPIKVKMLDNGKFGIISGHRRCEICRRLLDEGNDKFKFIPAIINKDNPNKSGLANNINDEINLIMSNATTRQLNDWEKIQQVSRLNELYQKLKAAGEKIPGRIDEIIGQQLNMSKSAVGRAKNIDKNLSDGYKKELEKGNLSVTAADKLASKPKAEQEKMHAENPAPKVSDLEQPNSLLPDAPEPPKTDKPYNGNGVYYDEYCTKEKLNIPKKYKMSMTIIIAHDTEDDQYRFGLRIADKTSGRSNPPHKTAAGYQSKELAKEAAITTLALDDTRKKALIEAGYISDPHEPTEKELEEQGQQTMIDKPPVFYKKVEVTDGAVCDGYMGGNKIDSIFIELCTDETTGKIAAYINIDGKRYATSLPSIFYYTQEAIENGMKML